MRHVPFYKVVLMRVLFQIPYINTIYAGRTIYYGYRHAFEDLGHKFDSVTANDNFGKKLELFKPDILITSLNPYNLRYMDLADIKRQKKRGMKVFVNTPFWKSPMSKTRVNETPSLSENKKYIELIKSGDFGDVYYNVCEQGDPRMEGFKKITNRSHHTILLAADKLVNFPQYSKKFQADISYVGTYLPEKKQFIDTHVFPLRKNYDLKLYGQDWTYSERLINFTQKVGQYFNIPLLSSIRKPKLDISDERKIYSSSVISINIHEDYQKKYGGDCNERTFKVPVCGGFEITDDVMCIRKYFKEGHEIIIAKDKKDWFDKIDYYIKNPEKRLPIIKAGRKKVLQKHTYHNRVEQMIIIYNTLN